MKIYCSRRREIDLTNHLKQFIGKDLWVKVYDFKTDCFKYVRFLSETDGWVTYNQVYYYKIVEETDKYLANDVISDDDINRFLTKQYSAKLTQFFPGAYYEGTARVYDTEELLTIFKTSSRYSGDEE